METTEPLHALVVTVELDDVELAADVLWGLGVVAIEERLLPASGSGSSRCELWTSLGDDSAAVVTALQTLPERWPYRFEPIDPAVSETWRQFAAPVIVDDDIVVSPAWVAPQHDSARWHIAIEPGATFGLGDHPTTQLSIRALKPVVLQQPGLTVLDVGCGSGVLAIAACLFGASSATAIDISPAAVPTTSDNAARNGVAAQVRVSTDDLASVPGQYDLVLANILAPALIALAGDLRRVLAPTGTLIISGILSARHDHVVQALAPLVVHDTEVMNGWAAVTLRWPTAP